MFDPMKFDKTVLPNGITVYSKPWPSAEYTAFDVVIPVGHRHNTGAILPGSFHFLEHLCCRHSEALQNPEGLMPYLKGLGARANAETSDAYTSYWMQIATERAASAIKLVLEHLQSVIITDKDVVTEASIITSELAQQSLHYPGSSRYEHYRATQWFANNSLPLRQVLGSPEDFAHMSADYFSRLHGTYFTPGITVYVGGTFDLDAILEQVARIKTVAHELPISASMALWERQHYHEAACLEEEQYVYHFGGYIPPGRHQVDVVQLFIYELLVNNADGALYTWLRRERQCIYSLDFILERSKYPQPQSWSLEIPMAEVRHVEPIRSELRSRIEDALGNQALITAVRDRHISQMVFATERLRDAVKNAARSHVLYGYTPTHRDICEAVEAAANPTALRDHYNQYWNEVMTGEFLATPIRS